MIFRGYQEHQAPALRGALWVMRCGSAASIQPLTIGAPVYPNTHRLQSRAKAMQEVRVSSESDLDPAQQR
ncbi:hypothetical protein E2C01_080556 [Portunus trituberculatus]|uniref:Uncharacterized protein n=1 Tax=Portunus trituberculatus TaxID=210409 RepID=A0A5B7IZX2_PORTR|nr:hypothetical protein [Portunus trituberculatus]